MVVHGSDAAESCRRRLSGRDRVRRRRPEQLPLPNADRHLLRQRSGRGSASPTALNERTVVRGGVRHQLLAPRRGRRPRRRAQRHRHARPLGERELPERERLRSRLTTGTTACRRIRCRRSSIRRSTPASSPAAAPAAGVTYGDPEIGGRPPRYQNWNAGLQRTLWRDDRRSARPTPAAAATFSAAAAAGSTRTSSIRASSSLGNLLTQQATAANIAAARAIVPGRRRCRTPVFPGRSRRCCGRSRSTRR